jgi:hypothetical protein
MEVRVWTECGSLSVEYRGRCEFVNEPSAFGCATLNFPRRIILHGVTNYVKFNPKNKSLKETPFLSVLSIEFHILGNVTPFILVNTKNDEIIRII